MSPIIYPIIFRFDDMTVPSGEDFTEVWQMQHIGGSIYETKESVHPNASFKWLIDGDAKLHELTLIEKRREWARPLRHIWPFVLVRYSLSEGISFTVGTLRGLIAGTRLDQEKSLTPAINQLLNKYEDSALFSKSMFLSLLNSDDPENGAQA